MNLYFIPEHYNHLSVEKLWNNVNYKKLGVGDVLIYVDGIRLIMVVCNSDNIVACIPSSYPMIAQVLCRDIDFSSVKPVLYEWDLVKGKFGQIDVLKFLKTLFHEYKLASEVLNTTINLLMGKAWRQDAGLIKRILEIKTHVPVVGEYKINEIEKTSDIGKGDKLLIVERYFSDKLKNDYYDLRALGITERETLVRVRRKYPKELSIILSRFYNENEGCSLYCKVDS
uniref:ASCH domain-containing protein n=2 Tax=unclassified Prevotella TaxID=2638335 RepID=A0AB33IZU5_9BACT